MLEATRGSLLDGQSVAQIGPELLALVLSGALYIPLGYWIFRAGEKYAKRVGLLKRSG
jgi:ABC-2 type transport system permease protein